MIIGINGYAGSGKDTVGRLIQIATCENLPDGLDIEDLLKDYPINQWWLEEKSGWEIRKWAGKLKLIASILTGIEEEKFEDQDFKKTELPSQWDRQFYTEGKGWVHRPMLVREFLQLLGTDGLRTGLHENTWINALMADYDLGSNWIVTDTRFPNEAKAIKEAGGIVIRVDRPGVSAVNAHPSETGLDDWDFDHKIMNGSDMFALLFTVGNILRKEKLV